MDNMHLCLELANSEKEEDVIRILKSMDFWNDRSCWCYFGNLEYNYSPIGNQQSKPEAAVVEKIVNSVDVVLMTECLERSIDPEGPNAPKNVIGALKNTLKFVMADYLI